MPDWGLGKLLLHGDKNSAGARRARYLRDKRNIAIGDVRHLDVELVESRSDLPCELYVCLHITKADDRRCRKRRWR